MECAEPLPPFLSTLSLRRATVENFIAGCGHVISIHALLAESDPWFYSFAVWALCISIHALLAESDLGVRDGAAGVLISIHALLAESDLVPEWADLEEDTFLSTLSLRRATVSLMQAHRTYKFLSTLSLRRATRAARPLRTPRAFLSTLSLRRATVYRAAVKFGNLYFYPRSPCGERHDGNPSNAERWVFLSTLSLRRATR